MFLKIRKQYFIYQSFFQERLVAKDNKITKTKQQISEDHDKSSVALLCKYFVKFMALIKRKSSRRTQVASTKRYFFNPKFLV